ncbi:hypothetical protein MPSEU_000385100 [Mayamaea pseudoterrestris]|nr:hypothetical protein MPSEU_000385100 [Mayamaea pseudoterrestris]
MKGSASLFHVIYHFEGTWFICSTTDMHDYMADEKVLYSRASEPEKGTNHLRIPPKCGWCNEDGGTSQVPIIHYVDVGSPPPQNWRLNPEASFSDWKIVLKYQLDGSDDVCTKVYNCHRYTLALGPKACKYFWRLCNAKKFAENEIHESHITLPIKAAEVFYLLLDYCYGLEVLIDAANAVSLLYLAGYFDCTALYHEANGFCSTGISATSCGRFYQQASSCGMIDIVRAVEGYCVENFVKIVAVAKEIIPYVPLEFWLSLFDKGEVILGTEASQLVAEVCQQHESCLNPENFRALTRRLTDISYVVAVLLLECEARVMHRAGADDPTGLTALQTRCVDAMAQHIGQGYDSKYFQIPSGCSIVVANALLMKINE